MVLGFMQKFPWGEPTYFKEKILNLYYTDRPFSVNQVVLPPKIHTIREGSRWKKGTTIQMANGVRTKNYYQFNKDIPGLDEVVRTQRIDIIHRGQDCCIIFIDRFIFYSRLKYASSPLASDVFDTVREFNREGFLKFLQNDGLTEEQFWKFFKKKNVRNGQLIHWTDLVYKP